MHGISYSEHKTSDYIWRQVNILAGHQELVLSTVKLHKLSWFGSVMSAITICCQKSCYVLWGTVDGSYHRGRPRKSWSTTSRNVHCRRYCASRWKKSLGTIVAEASVGVPPVTLGRQGAYERSRASSTKQQLASQLVALCLFTSLPIRCCLVIFNIFISKFVLLLASDVSQLHWNQATQFRWQFWASSCKHRVPAASVGLVWICGSDQHLSRQWQWCCNSSTWTRKCSSARSNIEKHAVHLWSERQHVYCFSWRSPENNFSFFFSLAAHGALLGYHYWIKSFLLFFWCNFLSETWSICT